MKVLLHGFGAPDGTVLGFNELIGKRNIDVFIPQPEPVIKNYSLDDADSYDLMVFGHLSYFDKDLDDVLNCKTSAPKIYVDTTDDFFIKRIFNHPEIKYYFKRELYRAKPTNRLEWTARYLYGQYIHTSFREKYYNPQTSLHHLRLPYKIAIEGSIKPKKPLLPYPICVPSQEGVSWDKRDIDLSFILKLTGQKERADMFNYLNEFKEETKNEHLVVNPGNMKKQEFYSMLGRSKASISIRGYGIDTFRYWEIPSFGSALMSPNLPIVIPDNFVDGESALFFNSVEELKRKFTKYVVKSDEWREIAKNGHKHQKEYHTPKERVKRHILAKIDL